MTTATIGALRVVLGLDSATFTEGLTAAQRHLRQVGQQMQNVGRTMATVGAGMTAAITAPLIAAGFAASQAARESAEAMGQVEAALNSMGGASGKTKEELAGLADGLMRNSLYDDDDILRQVTANLLTFGRVAGAEFDRAQQAAVDLATRMEGDLQGATLLVGKALNDPIKGMAALGRAGVQLDDGQKALIRSMVATGNVAGAQRIILGELEKQFGGAAEAAQNADPYDRLRDSLNSLSESAGGIINRFLVPMADSLARVLDRFNALSPQMQGFVVAGAAIAAALGPALIAIGGVVSAIGAITAALAAPAFVAIAPVLLAVGTAVAVAVAAFLLFRRQIVPVLQDLWRAVSSTLGPPLRELFAAVSEFANALGEVFKAALESDAGQALLKFQQITQSVLGQALIELLRGLMNVAGVAIQAISQGFRVLTLLIRGDWSGAWQLYKQATENALSGLRHAFDDFGAFVVNAVRRMVAGVTDWLTGRLFAVLRGVIERVQGVSDAFFRLYDAVVGHSYVPDMVEGIAAWMARLDAGMVVPARNATDAAKSAFESLRDDVAGIMEGLLTDTERAARDLAQKVAIIQRGVGAGIITRAQGDQAIAGVAADGLSRGDPVTLNPLGTEARDIAASLREGLAKAQDAFDETAQRFGDAFADNMERVLRGDIRGVISDLLSDLMRGLLRNLGASLFKSMNSGGGIGSAVSGLFKGLKLPGFATGGSFKVGGASGIDRNVVAFRATKGEMVDIRKPGQDFAGGMSVRVVPSPYFDVQVERVATPISVQTATTAYGATRADMAQASRRQRQRFV